MYDRLNESVAKLLLEFQAGSNEELAQEWAQVVDGDYSSFVQELKGFINDPKLLDFLKSGRQDGIANDDKFTVSHVSIPVAGLLPTQNEIDFDKSLAYPLKNPESCKQALEGNNVLIAGVPIIIFNGKYIIDGHHRWSQVYCINPNAKIQAINFNKRGMSPVDMLKATQVAIAITSGTLPTQEVKGKNLFNMSPQEMYQAIVENISEGSASLLGKSKQVAAKKITMNCVKMQKNNRPIPGAPPRSVMPQTDEPKGNIQNVIKALSQGITQIGEPYIKQTNSEQVQQESKQMKKINEGNEFSNESEYDIFRNQLAILALKDKELKISYQQLPEISDTDLESWLQVTDPSGKIWKKYVAKIPIKGTEQKANDMSGYAKQITPLIYQFYKLAILKNKQASEGLEDVVPQQTSQMVESVKKGLNEDLDALLTETDEDSVEQADPVAMFQDFSDVTGSLADVYSTLVTYKTTYVQNPKIQQSIGSIMSGVQQILKQATQTMSMIGSTFGINEATMVNNGVSREMLVRAATAIKNILRPWLKLNYNFEPGQINTPKGKELIDHIQKSLPASSKALQLLGSKYGTIENYLSLLITNMKK